LDFVTPTEWQRLGGDLKLNFMFKDWRRLSAGKSRENGRADSSSRLEPQIKVIALTQFAFLTLGIATLKILIHSVTSVSPFIRWLDGVSLWLFSTPVIWSVYATIVVRRDNAPLSTFVARLIGIMLAVLSFLFLAAVVFYLSAKL